MKVKITFFEDILGTCSGNPEIQIEKSMTVFPRENGQPFLWDYQVKGFLKYACSMLRRVPGTLSSKLTAHKKVIDGLVFPGPRKIMLDLNGGAMGECQRPLRGQTAQGERIALAHSETCPEGTSIVVEFTMLNDKLDDHLREWLDYGFLRGLGQWRNSGKGRFIWEEVLLDQGECKEEKRG